MNILLIYASYSGSTLLVSEIIQEVLKSEGHEVTLLRANEVSASLLDSYDTIFLGSTSWDWQGKEGYPHNHMLTLLEDTLKNKLYPHKRFVVFGCGDRTFANFCGAVDHLENFVKNCHGLKVGDSLRVDRFFQNMDTSRQITAQWTHQIAAHLKS